MNFEFYLIHQSLTILLVHLGCYILHPRTCNVYNLCNFFWEEKDDILSFLLNLFCSFFDYFEGILVNRIYFVVIALNLDGLRPK